MFRRINRVFNTKELDKLFNRSVKNLNDQKLKEALAGFTECLNIDPKNARVLYNRGITYYLGGAMNKAIDDLSKSYVDNEMREMSLFGRGTIYIDMKEYQKAISDFDLILKEDPKKAAAWEAKGDCYEAMKQVDDAMRCYQKSIDLKNVGDGTVYMKMGRLLRGRQKYHESLEFFDKMMELSPSYDQIFFEKAQSLVPLKRVHEAIEEISTGINFNPSNPNGYILREQCYRLLGEHSIADADKEMSTRLKADLEKHAENGPKK